jgi:tRNA A37 threonylcarbamoyladenosine synthetase subunit TsaC/SUA5/YrdC
MTTLPSTDNPVGHDVAVEAREVLAVLRDGGVAIIPLNVAYAVIGCTEAAIRRIFEAKARSFDKPSGLFGCAAASDDLHVMDDRQRTVRDALINDASLPFSVVAPFNADHALLASVDLFVIETSSKQGTLDMLLNAGPFHNTMAELSHAAGMPVFGSSANRSLQGSKYVIADIEPELLQAADIIIDHGRCHDANTDGLSSTIIDFQDFSVVRAGCRFDEISDFVMRRFEISLAPQSF